MARLGYLWIGQESTKPSVLLSCSIPTVLTAKFVNSMCFGTLNSTPVHAISTIYDLWPISQAGRRGFDPRLPLLESRSCEPLQNAVLQCTALRILDSILQQVHSFRSSSKIRNGTRKGTPRSGQEYAAAWSLRCPKCRRASKPDGQWQTKAFDPCMHSYFLRYDEAGAIRLYLLDRPSAHRFWRAFTEEEIAESERVAASKRDTSRN
jgi:hypothetical protein